ncbi:hypothetical protein [Methanopyrus kandleri]|uniref:hypothetical protein n=1 Tax=Methanopyrus kandleri TaxID=2320 RepID=UPI0011E54453|nr:hypothetical protein [Methanopyrus kandleri]
MPPGGAPAKALGPLRTPASGAREVVGEEAVEGRVREPQVPVRAQVDRVASGERPQRVLRGERVREARPAALRG